jgi:hypothetical protein
MLATTFRRYAWPDGRLPRALMIAALALAGAGIAVSLPRHAASPSASSGSGAGVASSAAAATTAAAPADAGASAAPSLRAAQAPSSPAGGRPLPGVAPRIARTGTLALRVGDVTATLEQARVRAEALGGYVASQSAITRDGRAPSTGDMTIRVPTARFGALVTALAPLGRELARTVSSQDLTQDYVDTRSRLRNDHAVETRLLALLDRAGSVGDVLAVQDRLASTQQQIEEEQGRLAYLARITSYSTLSLHVATTRAAAAKPHARSPHPYGLRDAFSRAARLAVHTVDGIVIAAGALAPALLLAGIAALLVRRRRHSARTKPAQAKM